MRQIVATSDGVLKRRRLQVDGTPECVPFLPHEFSQRLSQLGLVDPSSQPIAGATLDDLDPAERARLRQFVERFHGDSALLVLTDDELDGALGFTTRTEHNERVPTLAGLLLIGKESSLRDLVPTHEVAFQVLDEQEVRFNVFTRAPLLRTFEWLETSFGPINAEQEIHIGAFRVPIPLVDRLAYREAIANALTHRDYTRLGAIHVRLEREVLVVSNPGGFVDGVSLDNLLSVEPRSRNPQLADAFKRIGIVERTGRGVDRIYRELLRVGRPLPDYTRSDRYSVTLRMATTAPDLPFLRMVLGEEARLERPLPMERLLVLGALRTHRRATSDELARFTAQGDSALVAAVEALVEAGVVEVHGKGRARSYTLAALLYVAAGQSAEYTRQAGFSDLQHEQLILSFCHQHGRIQRSGAMALCRLDKDRASRLLRGMVTDGRLVAQGKGRWTYYRVVDAE